MTRKLLSIIALMLALVLVLASCSVEKGIASAVINENGELVLTYTDGTTENLGVVKGEQGEKGEQGIPGESGATSTDGSNPQGLDFYLKDDGTYAVAIGLAKYLSRIEIPATYNGRAVTEIVDDNADGSKMLKEIIIPDSITSIDAYAFNDCSDLAVYISDMASWCSISFSGYCYCTKSLYLNGELVTDLVIPDGVTSISNYVFYNCTDLKSVTIPGSVTSIGEGAFYGCSSLTSIIIPDSVTSIGNSAFSGCRSIASIKYRGTEEEWNAISKVPAWDLLYGECTITYNYNEE